MSRHLKAHKKRATQRTFTCNTCGESCHNRAPYNAHIRTAHQPATATRKRTAQKTTDALRSRKDLRGRTKQVRVPLHNQPP